MFINYWFEYASNSFVLFDLKFIYKFYLFLYFILFFLDYYFTFTFFNQPESQILFCKLTLMEYLSFYLF